MPSRVRSYRIPHAPRPVISIPPIPGWAKGLIADYLRDWLLDALRPHELGEMLELLTSL